MLQITPEQVTPALRSLFRLEAPTGIRALAVLAGGNAGKILTDDPADPRWAFVREADDGVLYRGGEYDREALNEAVCRLRKQGLVALAFRDGDPSVDLFPPEPDAGAECLEFDRPIASSDLSPFLNRLPAEYELRRMDRTLWEQSPRRDEDLNRYGSMENFLANGMAICILHEGRTVCEAYADMEIAGMREVGIRTEEAYRRQGLAITACAHLIRLCEQAGSGAYWDCVRLNRRSALLAQKLGFRNQRVYKLLAWFPMKA